MEDSKSINKILGARVKDLRLQKGLSQEQLAEILELHEKGVSQIENGRNFVTSKLLAKIVNFFQVAPYVLFTPKPQIMLDEHINYKKEIARMLPGFSQEKLHKIYNILLVMKK